MAFIQEIDFPVCPKSGTRITFQDAHVVSKACQMSYLYALKEFAYQEFRGNLKASRKRLSATEAEELADLYPDEFMKFFQSEYNINKGPKGY